MEPSLQPFWHDWHFWIEVLKVAVGVVLAGVAGAITLMQYRVQRAALALDLFERRYAVFLKVWTLCSMHVTGRYTEAEKTAAWRDVRNAGPEAHFLFGPTIARYVDKVDTMVLQFSQMDETHQMQPDPAERARQVAEHQEAEAWLAIHGSSGARQKFGSYLDFSQWS